MRRGLVYQFQHTELKDKKEERELLRLAIRIRRIPVYEEAIKMLVKRGR
jgi:hypothetical protein